MTESKNYQILFDGLKESIKEQKKLQSTDFNDIIKDSHEIKVLQTILDESLLEEEPQIMTRS